MHTQMFSFLQFHFSFKANFYSSHLFLRVAAYSASFDFVRISRVPALGTRRSILSSATSSTHL